MATRYFFASLTRISNLPDTRFSVAEVAQVTVGHWRLRGGRSQSTRIVASPPSNLGMGRMIEVTDGDLIVGARLDSGAPRWKRLATGTRSATTCKWIALTSAGLFGKVTSKSAFLPTLLSLTYKGHVMVSDQKVGMKDFVPTLPNVRSQLLPVVLIVGTSMSAGKTSSARIIVRLLKEAGLKIIGAKLTGAGRYRDILSVRDAGADWIFDFVDVGTSLHCLPARRSMVRRLSDN